jgi:hypothetical protein
MVDPGDSGFGKKLIIASFIDSTFYLDVVSPETAKKLLTPA